MRNNRHRIIFAQSLTGKMEEQTAAAERNVRNPLCYSGEELAARGLGLEWLETDGLGGFACGTAVGVRTRKYHGWYIPAVPPPRKRWMVVAGCGCFPAETWSCTFLPTVEFATTTPAGCDDVTYCTITCWRPCAIRRTASCRRMPL